MKQLPFIQELTEARLFYDVKDIKNMTAKEIAEIVYYIFLLIEVWRLNKPSEAATYATQTLGYDDYRTMHYSATDLANLVSVLNNQDVFSGHIKIQADISIPLFQINRYLRDVARQSKSSESEDQSFFWRLEDYLKVYGNSTIRQLRRDISNWTDITYANKIQALSILRREFDKRGSSVDLYLRFKSNFKLTESINSTDTFSLVSKFLSSLTDKETKFYSIRDNCGPMALDLISFAKKQGITLRRVEGYFCVDSPVYSKADFTPQMKKEFGQTNLNWNNPTDRKKWIEQSKYSEEWKQIPHYWCIDDTGNILDPSGGLQFIKPGLATDLDNTRYKPIKIQNYNTLTESKNPTTSDIKSVSEWMRTTIDNLIIEIKDEPIDKFLPQIKEMYSTYDEFLQDAQRTKKIIKLLGRGENPLPIYVEKSDPHLFVMEGRHRMVAFWLYGLKTIPVAYCSKKINESIEIPVINNSIQYHETLNTKLWNNYELRNEVKNALLKIAEKFTEFLDVEKFKIVDYIITGSNCAFNYTSHSDIDLHVLLDTDSLNDDTLTEPFLMAKKSLWNSGHDITVKGYNVELYAEDIRAKDTLVATGIYSLLEDKWIKKPKYEEITIDDVAVKSKVTDIINRINDTIETKSVDDLAKLMDQIRKMRRAGLEEKGEFSVENLAFKVLRNGGYLDKIYEVINKEEDVELTLEGKTEVNSVTSIAYKIAEFCKPFLSKINENTPPLYRGQSEGLTNVDDKLFQSSTLENRKPRDTLLNDNAIIDQWFLDQFGIRYRSNHIMFATGLKRVVGHYGKPYCVIPIGNFQFCWSPSITDTLDLIPKAYEIHYEIETKYGIRDASKLNKEKYKKYSEEVNKEMIEKRLAHANYSESNLDAAINAGNELMIHCKEYYLLDVTDDEYKQIIKIAKGMK